MRDINSSSALRIYRALAKMTVMGIELYLIAEKKGFIDTFKVEKPYTLPSSKHFTKRIIPQIYDEVCADLTDPINPTNNWFVLFTIVTRTAENTVQ